MKKNPKRLRLSKETIAHLEYVKGGATWWWSCQEPPETRGFTNCEYCGPNSHSDCPDLPEGIMCA